MKREELAPLLREEYEEGLPCGVEKLKDAGLENIWFVVPPAPPLQNPKHLPIEAIARANRLLAELPKYEAADSLNKIISFLFSRREAIQSSRMEGTWSTIDHVLTPGEIYDQNEGKSERASVLGYAHTLEKELHHALNTGPSILSMELILRLHNEVMNKDPAYKGKPGHLREPGKPGAVVFIGGLLRKENSIYNPTPARHVARCLNDVMSWMSNHELIELGDAGMGMTLPVRMAIGHAHFEAVHPFSDGNGRVGRILLTLQMACSGRLPLYLSGFIETEKSQYVQALQEAQKKLNYAAIVEFICEAIVASRAEAEQTRSELEQLPKQWQEKGTFREQSAAYRALLWLVTHPIFTVRQLSEELKISTPAASRAATQLIEAKIVRERTGFGRNRIFAAEEVIELLSRGFGDDPALALEKARGLLE